MAHDIIMPALGMAQETGIIVSWKKRPGEAVKASDILMEVETDKSTVEVEAGHDGFLAKVIADVGVPVPVGQVIAVISADRNDVDTSPAPTAVKQDNAPASTQPVEAVAAKPAAPEPAPAAAPKPERTLAPATGGRVLASPKARREAEALGVDLRRLVRLGVPEPIHVADLQQAGAATAGGPLASLMRVTVARAPFERFLSWVDTDASVAIDATTVWTAFAAGSLRRATGAGNDQTIVVAASGFAGDSLLTFADPDLSGLRELRGDAGTDAATALTVLDLTGTPLSEYRPAGHRSLPHLTLCRGPGPDYLDIVLEFDPAEMPAATALEFLTDLADRAANPLRHLL